MRKRRVLKTIILSFIIIVLVAILAALVIVLSFISKHGDTWKSLKNSALSIAENSTREDFCTALTSTVYYDDGSVVTSLKAEKDVYYLDYDKIPKLVIDTFVSVEDKRFYEHKGVDYIAIVRAAWSLYTNKEITQGGSTITQQLSRNTYLSHEVSWDRKITELFLARALETKYSKKDILEFYINNVYFANGNYGIQSAAMGYFQKDVSELTLSECATIAGITQSPGNYNPITNPEANAKRRTKVLDDMLEQGYIDQAAHDEAMADDVYARIQTVNTQIMEESSITSYFNDALLEQLMDDFTSENMFSQALVKSSIIVFEKNENNTHIEYKDRVKNIYERIFMEKLKNKWFFLEVENEKHKTHRFGDYFNVSHVVATLLNKTFILKDWKYVDGFYEYNNFQIEEDLIKDTCTPRSLRYNTNEKIIFPYYYKDDKLHKYSEQEFKTIFPKGYKYLQSYRKELLKRKSDRTAQWFEYGRSQALNHINKDKLLISTIITNSVSLYKIPSECIPYAGMYIIPKCKSFSLDDAKRILESKMFLSYVQNVGIHISGESVRITSKDIMDFRF